MSEAPLGEVLRRVIREELGPVEQRVTAEVKSLRAEHGKLIAENGRAIGDLTRAIKKLTVARGYDRATRRSDGPNLPSAKMAAKGRS